VRDDVQFFITDRECREQVTLFNRPVGRIESLHDPKLRDLSEREGINLSAIPYLDSFL
jgi:hypothetical protein